MMRISTLLLLACVVPAALASISTIPFDEPMPDPSKTCVSTWLWQQKEKHFGTGASLGRPALNKLNCRTQGKCDDPLVRDASATNELELSFRIHIMAASNGTWPSGLDMDQIKAMMDNVAADLNVAYFKFNYEVSVHENDDYYCIGPFGLSTTWAKQIDSMKEQYAEDPKSTINIFCSCQDSSVFGTLLGIATFPWDKSALNSTGGLWINSITARTKDQEEGDKTLVHELGHNLGLWHTFHGDSEVIKCGSCAENYHSLGDPEANFVGDFCADTPATPQNFYCQPPTGTDCNGVSWGRTAYENYMGYSQLPKPGCQSEYSPQQIERSHCWVCDTIQTQVMNPSKC